MRGLPSGLPPIDVVLYKAIRSSNGSRESVLNLMVLQGVAETYALAAFLVALESRFIVLNGDFIGAGAEWNVFMASVY